MGFEITDVTDSAARSLNKGPNIVFEIEGHPTRYGSSIIYKIIRIGDDNLFIDGTWVIGGYRTIENQADLVNMDQSSTSIKQQLDLDKARGGSIQSMEIGLIDLNQEITRLITPGLVLDDVLGKKAKIYLGFSNPLTSFKDDYITIFRGIIDDIQAGPGLIKFQIAHPDRKKSGSMFTSVESKLAPITGLAVVSGVNTTQFNVSGPVEARLGVGLKIIMRGEESTIQSVAAGLVTVSTAFTFVPNGSDTFQQNGINSAETSIDLDNGAGFLSKIQGPNLAYDPTFRSYIKVDNEIIFYDSRSGNSLSGVVRAQFDTVAVIHASDETATSFYRLTGNAVDLALKTMSSGIGGDYAENINILNFNKTPEGATNLNSIFLQSFNVNDEHGLTLGDYITTTGAANGANNVTLKEIVGIDETETGIYLTIGGVTFVEELDTAAIFSIRSKYDTLPDGLKLPADFIDVEEHEKLKNIFLGGIEYDFYLKESIDNGKDWLELEIYKPMAAYSLSRKSRASLGYLSPPIPGSIIPILSEDNVNNASQIRVRRSINKNFANTIVYKYDENATDENFGFGSLVQSAPSVATIKVGSKSFNVISKGLRFDLSGANIVQSQSNRRLRQFEFGAEYIEGLKISFGTGFNIETGDIVIFDTENLSVINTVDGNRVKPPTLYMVSNISKEFNTGKIVVDLMDTNYDGQPRYGKIAPCSQIKSGINQTQFIIEPLLIAQYGVNEWKKWDRFTNPGVRVRSPDFVRNAQTRIVSISGNQITVGNVLGFTPQPGDILELCHYDFVDNTDEIKLLYCFMNDGPTFGDGADLYKML